MKTSMHVDYHYIPRTEIVALPDVSVNKPFCLHEGDDVIYDIANSNIIDIDY